MSPAFPSLAAAAVAILETAEAGEKVRLTGSVATAWQLGRLRNVGTAAPPIRPARSARPELKPPRDVPKRGLGSLRGRIALLHALAHIELNAIDLAWDLVARFGAADLPRRFFDDWVKVAGDEARHHALLARRLESLGAAYGDLPAHDGLWEAAADTAEDLLARLAIVPLVLEARALDVTPGMVARLRAEGDEESAALLQTIYDDEISHVAIGQSWFTHLCSTRGLDPVSTWQGLVARYFKGQIKPPFNEQGRRRAGLDPRYYLPIAASAITEA